MIDSDFESRLNFIISLHYPPPPKNITICGGNF